MDRQKRFAGLEFNNNFVFDQKIGAKSFQENLPSVVNGYRLLPFDRESVFSDLVSEDDLVNCFQEARSKRSVHLVGGIQYPLTNLVLRHHGFLSFATLA